MTIGIDTDAIIKGGKTFMSRNLVKAAKFETFGLGRCDTGYDKLFKANLITKALSRDNDYTQEEIQCLESELLGEIQTAENLQAVVPAPLTPPISAIVAVGGVDISGG